MNRCILPTLTLFHQAITSTEVLQRGDCKDVHPRRSAQFCFQSNIQHTHTHTKHDLSTHFPIIQPSLFRHHPLLGIRQRPYGAGINFSFRFYFSIPISICLSVLISYDLSIRLAETSFRTYSDLWAHSGSSTCTVTESD